QPGRSASKHPGHEDSEDEQELTEETEMNRHDKASLFSVEAGRQEVGFSRIPFAEVQAHVSVISVSSCSHFNESLLVGGCFGPCVETTPNARNSRREEQPISKSSPISHWH